MKNNTIAELVSYFTTKYPSPKSELNFKTPYEMIVAVMLSAQCTDIRVNMITPPFFKRFPTIEALSKAGVNEVYELIKSCSYPNNKSKYLVEMAKIVKGEYNGTIPSDIDTLQKLPGIGRKSANVLVLTLYNQPVIPVDTHVHRVSARIGLTKNAKSPLQTETQLMEIIPRDYIHFFHHWLVLHGRYVCKARRPSCDECGITGICTYFRGLLKVKMYI